MDAGTEAARDQTSLSTGLEDATALQGIRLMTDFTVWGISLALAFFLRMGSTDFLTVNSFAALLIAAIPLQFAALWVAGVHREAWSRADVAHITRLAGAVLAVTLALFVTTWILQRVAVGLPRSAPLISGGLAFLGMVSLRLAAREWRPPWMAGPPAPETNGALSSTTPTRIAVAAPAGRARDALGAVGQAQLAGRGPYELAGWIETDPAMAMPQGRAQDNPEAQQMTATGDESAGDEGAPPGRLGPLEGLGEIVDAEGIEAVIVVPSLADVALDELVAAGREAGIPVWIVPVA